MAMVPARRIVTRADWCGLIVTSKLRSRAVAVCGTMSWLTQTIVSPTLRLAGAGPKRIRVISITCSADGGAAAVVMRQQSTAGSRAARSAEHTSELQSLMRISYAVCCLQKKMIRTQLVTDRITNYQ